MTGQRVVLLSLTFGLGFAHGYLLGDGIMLCWKGGGTLFSFLSLFRGPGDLLGRRGPAVRLGRFRLGPRVWSGSAIRPATPHASAASWHLPFSLCRHPLSAGSWRDPSGPTPREETASLGRYVDHIHRFRALCPRSRVVCHELSQFGRQVVFSAAAAHVARKSRIFGRISRARTFDRR
jgi:hypothetical protein